MTERPYRRRGLLTREDIKLWAHVTHSVTPLPGRAAFRLPDDLVATLTPMEAPAPASPAVPLGSSPARPAPPPLQPLERRLRQRLSRGQREVDGVIDLHGLRQSEAHGALIHFIARAQHEGRSLVLVITGKGASAEPADRDGRGVLRRLVPHWLGDPVLRRHVVGFEEAAREHGGAGALYVRIRKIRPRP